MLCVDRIYNQLRAAIKACGRSRYTIAKETGISESHLSQLMDGTKGMSVEAIEKLADALDLEIVFRKRRKGGKGR